MPGPEFHQTPMGRSFFDGNLPRLIQSLNAIATSGAGREFGAGRPCEHEAKRHRSTDPRKVRPAIFHKFVATGALPHAIIELPGGKIESVVADQITFTDVEPSE